MYGMDHTGHPGAEAPQDNAHFGVPDVNVYQKMRNKMEKFVHLQVYFL